jgi:hypothetical protein
MVGPQRGWKHWGTKSVGEGNQYQAGNSGYYGQTQRPWYCLRSSWPDRQNQVKPAQNSLFKADTDLSPWLRAEFWDWFVYKIRRGMIHPIRILYLRLNG